MEIDKIPDRLKALRQAKGWTQEEVAGRLGVALRTLQRWEAGTHKPSMPAMRALQDLEEKAGRRVSEEEVMRRIAKAISQALQAHGLTWPEQEVKALAERIYSLTKEQD